jgi:hypothetical protein
LKIMSKILIGASKLIIRCLLLIIVASIEELFLYLKERLTCLILKPIAETASHSL